MVKLYRIPGTDVKIRMLQNSDYWVMVTFAHDETTSLDPDSPTDGPMIQSLGFPLGRVDGGDLEEVTE